MEPLARMLPTPLMDSDIIAYIGERATLSYLLSSRLVVTNIPRIRRKYQTKTGTLAQMETTLSPQSPTEPTIYDACDAV